MRIAVFGGLLVAAVSTCALAQAVEPPPDIGRPSHRPAVPALVTEFYDTREHALVWVDERRYDALLNALYALRAHGLDPSHYHAETLERLRGNPVARDRLATDAWLSAALHLLRGKVDPLRIEPNWTASARQADLHALLDAALDEGEISATLLGLAPVHPEYLALHAALERLLSRPPSPTAVLPASRAVAEDPPLDDATRLLRLRANLERWRWLPERLGGRHVRVNIAAYRVTRHEQGRILQSHRAIVGRTYRKTPVFSDSIRYIVFNPWWETPRSIAVRDELPLFRRDPSSVQRLGFQVLDTQGRIVDPATIDWHAVPESPFPYRLRQAPGPLNALGRAKVMFPNRHNVYLHDTAAPALFAEQRRTFSSGCVRTEDIRAMTTWLLEGTPGWDATAVDAALADGETIRADLAESVPIHILYFTAEPDPDGSEDGILYLSDVYDRDARLVEALDRAPGE
jgi:murein L,D-transpeptidase YcbB/YkuD